MKPNEHEFKLMGMAPYADQTQVNRVFNYLKKYLWVTSDGRFASSGPTYDLLPKLSQIYSFERFDVISGAIQKLVESLLCEWITYWINSENINLIGLSGGVSMNVKALKIVSELDNVRDFFVMPSASDESLAFGSIWLANKSINVKTSFVKDLYLGRKFDNKKIDYFINQNNLKEKFLINKFLSNNDLNKRVAELLSTNKIINRFCGGEEFGARALGNRSIICDPSNFKNIEELNSKIKNRDFWMPFTPSILEEYLDKYIINPKNISAPYMALTFDTKHLAKNHFAAAVHPRDFTMRPQSVIKSWNPIYYDLIYEYYKITGIPGILNTSFNLHGEPNVSSPKDAIKTVLNSGLKYLILENYLLEKI